MEDEKYDYSLSVNEGIINNQNVTSSKVTVNVAQVSDKDVSLTLNVKGLDVNGKDKVVTKPVTITKNTTKVEVDGINVSDLVDGVLSVELVAGVDKDAEVVGTTTVIKNTEAPAATNVNTKRTATRTATLSLEGYGKNDITKVYYVIGDSISDIKDAKTIEVSNNKVENYEISNELTEGASANVTFILENKYGSRSVAETVVIAKDNANQATAVKELKATVTDGVATGKFTWKDEKNTGAAYVVNILKDNKVIAFTTTTDKEINISSNATETGTYKITVQVKGTADIEASETVTSDEIVVSKLEAVKNVKLENKEDGKTYLTYENPNKEGTFKEIKVQLISLDNDGKEETPINVTLGDKGILRDETNTSDITLTNNKIYFVKISVVAKDGQVSLINSDEATSNKIYSLTTIAPSLTNSKVTDNSVECTVSNPIAITGIKTEYKVEIYDASNADNSDKTKPQYTKLSEKNVELSKDGKIVIDGLESNKKYAFKLITTVEGKKLESDYTSVNTKATMPAISNLTVTKDDKDAKENAGKIFADENKMIINKTVYNYKENIYPTELTKVASLVNKALKAEDVISINEKTITATLNNDKSYSKRSFEDEDLKDYTLNVCNNEFTKIISGTFKEINLNGTGAIYDLNGVTANTINVNSDVEVKGDKTYAVNSKAIINGVKVSTVAKTTISANAQNLTVTPNTESNTLGFESDEVLTINFVGSKDQTSIQKGTINVVANKGVTITTNCNIAASMNVTVAKGTVDLTADALNGSKKVTIAKDGTITLATRKTAPVDLSKVALKDYTDDELIYVAKDEANGIEEKGIKGITKDNVKEVKEYISSIKSVITNNNPKITVAKDATQVTIELTK